MPTEDVRNLMAELRESLHKDCPGRCGRRIVHAMVACHWCWLDLPPELRDAVSEARVIGVLLPSAHRRAVTAALAWYRQRNAEAATGGSRGERQ